MCVCVFCWRNGALTCRYVQCDRARQNEEYMICICTCVCVCVLVHNVPGTRRRLCCCALSLCLSLSWNCKFLPLLLFCSSSFYWFSFLPSSNVSVAFHSSPAAASAAAANLRVWRITPRGGEEIARRCSGIELNWKGKQKQNLHRLVAVLSSPYLLLSLSSSPLSIYLAAAEVFCECSHTYIYTNVPKCIVYVWVCVCVCICSCSCRCRLEKTTIASPGKWFRRRRKFNMPYLYFLSALAWALFCAGLRSVSALPPCRSLFLFVLSFVSICIWL